jgi:putative glycosyltransferase (TIGR04348 family)
MKRPEIVLVTPALADANNGNWRTAQRWARLLAADYRVKLALQWAPGSPAAAAPQAMIALHARRSAAAIQAWRAAFPHRLLVVVLTGTDLYRDIAVDADAQRSLVLADRLVVLNELGLAALPPALRGKAHVCLQSSPARQALPKTARRLRALMVGHLRDEKCPQTYFEAAARLAGRDDILLDHIGLALDPALGEAARACAQRHPGYRWLGGLPHGTVRRHIQRAHVLVHASRMEGGAQVVVEAITSGTPVLASRIDGNLGLLGTAYSGIFDTGDSAGLAVLLQQCRDDPAMLPALQAQCAARAERFSPAHERQVLLDLLAPVVPP